MGRWILDANWVFVLALTLRQDDAKAPSVVASPKHWGRDGCLSAPIGNWWGLSVVSPGYWVVWTVHGQDVMTGRVCRVSVNCCMGSDFVGWQGADWGSVTSIVQVPKPYSMQGWSPSVVHSLIACCAKGVQTLASARMLHYLQSSVRVFRGSRAKARGWCWRMFNKGTGAQWCVTPELRCQCSVFGAEHPDRAWSIVLAINWVGRVLRVDLQDV